MSHETNTGFISHAELLESLIVGVFGSIYIDWKPVDSGRNKPWPGRTFYHDACKDSESLQLRSEPLQSKQLIPKTCSLFRDVLTYGYNKSQGQTPNLIPYDAISSKLISELEKMPVGRISGLDLGRLTIRVNDEQHAEKVEELVLLLEITLKELRKDAAGKSNRQAVYNRTESRVLELKESLCISFGRDDLALACLIRALKSHNKNATEGSGTYQLGEIANDLVSSISSDARKALFEYRDGQFPLLQCLRKSWKEDVRPNFMLVGEGGIGKTVSMLKTAEELCRIDVPAVYIPLHAVPFLNAKDTQGNFIHSYIKGTALKTSRSALIAIEAALHCEASDEPSLVIFLDGWNEISERQVGGNQLTEIIQEEIESIWLSSANVQVVIAGRAHMDPSGTWYRRWRYLKAQSLKRTNIEAYLKGKKVPLPPEDHPIWKTLGNPLMLTLYACNEAQKNDCEDNPCCRFIDDDQASTQAAVIWNFLQCQINKASIISKGRNAAFAKIIAINYAAAYIGWEMVKNGVFRINRGHLKKLLNKAERHFENVWEESSYVSKVSDHCEISVYTWNTKELSEALLFSVKLLTDETSLSAPDQQDDTNVECNIGFLHQNFRDFYAALFMRNEFAPFGTLRSPEDSAAWVKTPQSSEILDMLAALFGERELSKLWNSTKGTLARTDSNAMFHVVEVMQRRKLLGRLSFENRDLRFVSLQGRGFSGSDVNFSRSWISYRTFLLSGHSGEVSEAVWLLGEDGRDERYILTFGEEVGIGKIAEIWDTRKRLGIADPVWSKHHLVAAINSTGRLVVLANKDCDLDIYDTVTQKAVCHTLRSKIQIRAVAPLHNSTLIAYGGIGTQVYLFDIAMDKTMPLEIPNDHKTKLEYKNVKQIVCSEDGRKIAILYESGVVTLWGISRAGCETRANFEAACDLQVEVVELQINRDGSRLFAVTIEAEIYISEQGDVSRWEKLNLKIEECDAFKISFRYGLLAVALDNRLDIRSLRNEEHCKLITMATDLNSKPGKVCRMNFSPSGERLVCVHENNSVTAWDVRPNYLGFDKRPLFAIEGRKDAIGGMRLQSGNALLALTGQGRFLKWDASNLYCTDDFTLEGVTFDHWDSSFDGNRYYASTGSLIRIYDAQGTLIKTRQHENKVLDIRLDEQSGMVIVVDNTPSLVCLNEKTLDVVSRVKLEDHGDFTVAPLDGDAVVSLDKQCHLTIRRLPDLETINIISIWDAMKRSKKQEICRIGMMEKEKTFHNVSSDFTQLETFRTSGENGVEMALVVIEISGSGKGFLPFLLAAVIDLTKEVATMAFCEESGSLITGIAVNPEIDRFFQSTLSGYVKSRELSTGKYLKSVRPIPNITLVNADFRGAKFVTEVLRDMVRASGAIVDDNDPIANVEPQQNLQT